MPTPFRPKPGDHVQHKYWQSYGIGVLIEPVASELPSLPPSRWRVKFGDSPHVTRSVHVDDLEPLRARPVVAASGGLVA